MDERRTQRVVSDAEVTCRFDGMAHRLSLYDLSAHGCMMTAPIGLPVTGCCIVVEFADDMAASAEVVWQRGNSIGVVFAAPLPHRLVEDFAFKIAGAANAPGDPLGPVQP